MRHGCAVNVHDSFKMTPAEHAEQNGFDELSQWLMEKSGERRTAGVKGNQKQNRLPT